jgi:RNA-binding protein YhbY
MNELNNISGKERRSLKSVAKTRNVDIKIGKKGITNNVLKEIEFILKRDSMVKVSFKNEKPERLELQKKLQLLLNSSIIESVGKTSTYTI